MKAVVVHRPGGLDKLVIETRDDPRVTAGQVLVETEAIGVNFADCVVRMGLYESAKKYVGWPITPGFECAGRVSAVGPDVDGVSPGDRVIALVRFGAYATHVVAPHRQVFPVPPQLTVVEASTFLVGHLTAWYALRELCKLRPGMRVLVHSAAGGVGSALVQIARACRCEVVGVIGASHKREAVAELGAVVIDKSRENLWTEARRLAPDGYDVVLDANGVETLGSSYEHLAPTGRLITYGFHTMLRRGTDRPNYPKLAVAFLRTPRFNPLWLANENKGVLGFNLSYLFEKLSLLDEAMPELRGWLQSGDLTPPRVTMFPFDRVADAHKELESGATIGKLALVP